MRKKKKEKRERKKKKISTPLLLLTLTTTNKLDPDLFILVFCQIQNGLLLGPLFTVSWS